MDLAAFIRLNESIIVTEWQGFARTYLPSAAHMSQNMLRDHVVGLLQFIANDLETPETERQRSEKAKGQGSRDGGGDDSAAETHADLRFTGGFDTIEMISEFRALRASVLKLWRSEWTNTEDVLPDLLRFNEAIDQVTSESLARFSEKLKSAGSILAETLAYHFQGPLEEISSSAKGLQRESGFDSKGVELLSRIESNTARLTSLASDLIDAVGVQLGKGVPIWRTQIDFEALIREVIEKTRALHQNAKIQVTVIGDLTGECDRARIGQVISTLIDNAVHQGPKDSQVNIAVNGVDDEVTMSVQNEGVMSAESVATMFDPLPRTKSKLQSEGATTRISIGLFIAKAIMNAHGGYIKVTSSVEQGTTVTATLPRKKGVITEV